MAGSLKVGFLVCPPESMLDGFAHSAADLDPDLVRAVSSHLSRCAQCREEVDRRRRGLDAAGARRPWIWALIAFAALSVSGVAFLWREPARPAAASAERFTMSFTGREAGFRPDPRIASLARIDPPSDAAVAAGLSGRLEPILAGQTGSTAPSLPALSAEDHRELSAARARLQAGSFSDAARLLEDLTSRHPSRGGLRLLLAYSYARSGEFEKAQTQYRMADGLGAGVEACLGLANTSLRIGDVPTARLELEEHVLARRPYDDEARDLLDRINSTSQRLPR
jgi:Flp pilus assembly protein TadD